MRSSVNLALQLAATTTCVALRLTSPGWLLVIFFVLLPVVTLGLVLQVVTAACVLRRRWISTWPALWSVATAGCLLGASLLVTDGGDSSASQHRPVDVLLGTHLGPWADELGWLLVLGWLAGLVGTGIAMVATRPVPPLAVLGPAVLGPAVLGPAVLDRWAPQPHGGRR